ncbi:MAG: hypothetical protein PHE86_05085 [Candidatus Marinimicrobia bacterium]|nr:hypothetical protein [Candidatus Neomarinimicrobiota bacterium]MDD5581803.1 hypothetical protein [Candidatus Neomarinimicrobiota bacterium]
MPLRGVQKIQTLGSASVQEIQVPRDARRSIPAITKFKSLITRYLSHIPDSKSLKSLRTLRSLRRIFKHLTAFGVPVPLRGVQAPRDARCSIPAITKFKSLITRYLSYIPDSKFLKISASFAFFAVNIQAPRNARYSRDSSASLRSAFNYRCCGIQEIQVPRDARR